MCAQIEAGKPFRIQYRNKLITFARFPENIEQVFSVQSKQTG